MTLLVKAHCRVNIFRKVLRDPSEAPGRFREAFGVRTRPRVAFWGMAPAQKRCGDASHSQSATREMWFEARTLCPPEQGTREFWRHQSLVTSLPPITDSDEDGELAEALMAEYFLELEWAVALKSGSAKVMAEESW